MSSRKFLLFCYYTFVLLFEVYAQGENINFTSLSTKDGLSSNTVNMILKDRYGLMWFGTTDGLNKFDGTHFTVYRNKPGDTTSLQANEILSLYEDKEGNLWIGTSGGSLSLYNRQNDSFINFPSNGNMGTIRNNVILYICGDYLGRIWISHYTGINILDPSTKRISDIFFTPHRTGFHLNKSSTCLLEDQQHNMWIGTSEGLYQYNPKRHTIKQFLLPSQDVRAIAEDYKGNIWTGTSQGLSVLSPGSNRFVTLQDGSGSTKTLAGVMINSIAVDREKLWIGTEEGLDIVDTRNGEIVKFGLDYRNIHSITARAVRSVYIDKQGIYWLGTSGGGVNKYDKNLNLFNHIKSNVFDEQGLNASRVTSFEEAENGKVFVGTEGKGLSLFTPQTNLFKRFNISSRRNSSKNELFILDLEMTKKKQLLIGTFADGLYVLNPTSGVYRQLLQGTAIDDLNSNDIFCIKELRNGNIWVGTNGKGINVLNSEFKVLERYTPQPKAQNDVELPINGYIRDLMEDRSGNIWIGTHGGGLAVFQPGPGKFKIYNSYNNAKLPNDQVQSILEDKSGRVWVATLGGLALFNPKLDQFTTFSEKEGLQNNTVYQIVEDQKGLLWVSTNKGISSIDPGSKKINNYNYHNGVQNNNFIRGSGLRLSGGDIYFGGLEGFNYFNPSELKKNTNIPGVLITDLKISNQSVAPSKNGPIQQHVSVAKVINLDYKQNLALNFVGLNYTAPEQNQYAYKLDGFDKDWNYVGSNTTASYTNLDPGDYTFRIKASNNDGLWNTEGASIKVHVRPPFWRTIYAYIFYTLIFMSSLFYLRHKGIRKIKKKYALEQESREAERIRELDRLKIKFLTNLSHEFRTPISLILGPVDSLLMQEKSENDYGKLEMIKRNAKRLMNLVNQLLDFRKMEQQELKLNASEGELVNFIKDVSDSFKDLAERKKIDFVFTTQIDKLYTLFDHDKLERILFNILSNAFKFTLEGGKITVQLERIKDHPDATKTWVALKVSDTGIGIPADKQEKIFDLFFQNATTAAILNQGTGIGLFITKEFVKMHDGIIHVDSEPGKGTSFSITLPFTPIDMPATYLFANETKTSETIEEKKQEETEPEASPEKTNQELITLLLVEDNDDFRFYLKDNLRLRYKVCEAVNGKEGWQKALAQHPQLIVSDISMPEMDGIELCRKIKSDKRTSHIPVILLTAFTGEEDQLKGLKTGANDYITKPFNFELLNAKITNLLTLNATLKNTYTKRISAVAPEIEIQSNDEKLLQNILLYIEDNLTNPKLSVEKLSKHVSMSRSSLYSKLLELTGQTPVEFIRSVKLDKAAILLEKSDMHIAQIAYSVGFSSPNYFAKAFKAKFNIQPSEYIIRSRNATNSNDNQQLDAM